jgi:hypothetical protein
VQAVPFRLKLAGDVSLLVQVPWKPNETFPPGPIGRGDSSRWPR